MNRPRLLDLFCGAGGAGMGYYLAGFDVTGIDIKPQPHYPFKFIQADALTYTLDGYDAYHASPPCQGYSYCTKLEQRQLYKKLIGETRYLLQLTGKPFIIENVLGAKKDLRANILLCGTMFGLPIHRHRIFESFPTLAILTSPCKKREKVFYITGSRRDKNGDYVQEPTSAERKIYLGTPWMTINEMDEAIPPAYTEYIGKYLLNDFIK